MSRPRESELPDREAARLLRELADRGWPSNVLDALHRGAERLDPPPEPHVIEIRADGWTIMHPLACRPHLFDCPLNRAAEILGGPPTDSGRYVVELDSEGHLRIGAPA